jgi:hypothetical protein
MVIVKKGVHLIYSLTGTFYVYLFDTNVKYSIKKASRLKKWGYNGPRQKERTDGKGFSISI